jgi:hypothetical protein
VSKKIKIELRPEHALQYASILTALIEAGPQHPAFQGMFEDLRDKLVESCTDQLTLAEVARYTKL